MTASSDRTATWTGLAWLGIVGTGIFAEFFVRSSLVVPGDAMATAANVAAARGLFAAGIAADVAMVVLDVTVAVGLWRLLRPTQATWAFAATAFRLTQAIIIAANLLHLTHALSLARGPIDADTAARILAAIETHALVYDVALIAFGLACVVVGWHVFAKRLVPIPYGPGLVLTGAVYLVGSCAALGAPGLSAAIDPLYGIAIVVEPAFALRLVAKGLGPGLPSAERRRARGLEVTRPGAPVRG